MRDYKRQRKRPDQRQWDRAIAALFLFSAAILMLWDSYKTQSLRGGSGAAYASTGSELALTSFLSRYEDDNGPIQVSKSRLATIKSDAAMPITGYLANPDAATEAEAQQAALRIAQAAIAVAPAAAPAPKIEAKTLSLVGHLQSQYDDDYSPRITSGYGYRRLRGYFRHHDGIDIALPYGAPIKAAWGGKVVYSGWKGGYGRAVIVDHGDGKETLYAHASKLYVPVGKAVEAGEVIAKVGTSGHSYGPHIHFELRVQGKAVNPRRAVLKIYAENNQGSGADGSAV